jgi:F-type H+-transporting ATPase subunit b
MRIGPPLALLALVVLLLAAPAAWAAEGGGQSDLLDFDLVTALATIVVFVVLLVVLTAFAWKPILKGLQAREATIQKALDDAAKAHEQAKALIADYERRIENARQEAQSIFDEARRDAQDIRRQIEEDGRKRADETVERSRREVEQLHAKAWERLVRDAAAVATEAASRIVKRELTPESHAALVADVVREFERSGTTG